MKNLLFLILLIFLTNIVLAQRTTALDATALTNLKQSLTDAKSKYACNNTDGYQILINQNALDKYLRTIFGKVALDNQGYVNGGPAFNISFDKDKALISGNYSRIAKKSEDIVWNIGGKAESDDGTYYLFSKTFNFGIGVKAGVSFFLGSNKMYYNTNDKYGYDICEKMVDLRNDTMRMLRQEYESLFQVDIAEVQNDLTYVDGLIDSYRSDVVFDEVLPTVQELIEKKTELLKVINDYNKFFTPDYSTKKWSDKIVGKSIDEFDYHIANTYATGYKIKWIDVSADVTNENKNILDTNNVKNKYVTRESFARGNLLVTFNLFRLSNRLLSYLNVGISNGVGYGYDLLNPKEVEADSPILTAGRLDKVGKRIKVYDPSQIINSDDTIFKRAYYAPKITFLYNLFVGKRKVVGFEISSNIGVMVRKGDTRFPFAFQGGLLFSPVNKDKLKNDGVVGFIVGMKNLSIGQKSTFSMDNFYAGIRVGLPLSPQLTRKDK